MSSSSSSSHRPRLAFSLSVDSAAFDFTTLPAGISYIIHLQLPYRGIERSFDVVELRFCRDGRESDLFIRNITQEEIDIVRSCKFMLHPSVVLREDLVDPSIPGRALLYLSRAEHKTMSVTELAAVAKRDSDWWNQGTDAAFNGTYYEHDARQLWKYPGLALVAALRRGLVVAVRPATPKKKTEEDKVGEALEKLTISAAEKDVQ